MKRTVSLAARFGWLGAHATYVHATLLAAHVSADAGVGFRPSHVRFYFLLFTNWMEADVTRPGQDLDLTQIRRAVARLVALGHAARVGGERRRPSYRLTRGGVTALADAVVDPDGHRSFEEMIFAIAFAAAYGELLGARLRGGRSGGTAASPLDPRRALRSAKRALLALSQDLEERIRSSAAIEKAADGRPPLDVDLTRLFAQHGGYQLERVKPLRELLQGLPSDVRAFELTRGIQLRRELLFTPMAESVKAQVATLDAVARRLGV